MDPRSHFLHGGSKTLLTLLDYIATDFGAFDGWPSRLHLSDTCWGFVGGLSVEGFVIED